MSSDTHDERDAPQPGPWREGAPAAFPIVGIGASAGGLEALAQFFDGLTPDCGIAFVIVTHLSPDRPSLLPGIVARYTALIVEIAQDGHRIVPGHVYVMPANAMLTVTDGTIRLREPLSGRRDGNPVDVFLASLAADWGENAVGVVLSGSGADGTLGIKAIKEHGGLTMAQVADGTAPAHNGMPGSAIATGLIDFALPVQDMVHKLSDVLNAGPLAGREGPDATHAIEDFRPALYSLLRQRLGHDFSGYKTATFMRRVRRRMQVLDVTTPDDYIALLHDNATEIHNLFRDLLINVTTFFRDAEAFAAFETLIVPQLLESRDADGVVRIWVPGCSTGEEVFSIAMLLLEGMDRTGVHPRVQIFATDIDDAALAVARTGRYPAAMLHSVSPERRQRFFTPDGSSFVVSKEIRNLCIFSPHSVLRDPPFSRMDLISCRNLLIYFGLDAQAQVIPTFRYALRPRGFLFLGTSESLSQFSDLFVPLDKKQRIFQARDTGVDQRLLIPLNRLSRFTSDARQSAVATDHPSLRSLTEARIHERHAPAYVVVNRDGEVLLYSARTGRYLEAPLGAPTRQLLTIARKGLRLALRSALREATENRRAVRRDAVTIDIDGDAVLTIDLVVEPIGDNPGNEPVFLVLFKDLVAPSGDKPAINQQPIVDGAILHLERELRDTRDRLQSTIEEYEAALEELKSSNEELVSVNEELQSTNEELEASKEELQSLNEELQTVNVELGGKLDDLDQANSDLKNLFDSTEIATVFLDETLVIRSFSPAVARIFRLIPSDRGRPLTDLATNLVYPELYDHLHQVFDTGERLEHRIREPDRGVHYLVRLIPYRTTEQRVAGVVLTFVDVTTLHALEQDRDDAMADLQARVATVQSVAAGLAGAAPSDGMDPLVDRIEAMGRGSALMMARDDGVPLDGLVSRELLWFGMRPHAQTGPEVVVRPRAILPLVMALHELAATAARHGEWMTDRRRVDVTWHREPGGAVTLTWIESGLAVTVDDAPSSACDALVRGYVEQELGGTARFERRPDGRAVTLTLPL